MRLEDRLQRLIAASPVGPDPDASLDAVIAAGRRKRTWRLAGAASGVVTVVVIAIAGAAALGAPPARPTIDPIGSPAPSPSGSASASDGDPDRVDASEATPSKSPSAVAVSPAPSPGGPEPSTTPSPVDRPVIDPEPPPPALQFSVTTDARAYHAGDAVTITIEACNGDPDEPIEEFFFEEGNRYTVRVLTEDRRAVAGSWGRSYETTHTTEVWAPGECRRWTEVWDQTEGAFDDDGGQAAEPGGYTILLDWHGVTPPPPGTDPGLYDPEGRGAVSESPAFTIESRPPPTLLPTGSP